MNSNPLKGMIGGEGAADFGVKTYGNMGQQQAGEYNSLQMKQGGRRRRSRSRSTKGRKGKKKGGYGLTEVLVPATLFAANYAYGRNDMMRVPQFARNLTSSSRRSRRSSRRFRR